MNDLLILMEKGIASDICWQYDYSSRGYWECVGHKARWKIS